MGVMLLFGVIGYLLENAKFPLAPVVLGLVLGPIAENQFRRAMQMSGDDLSIFFTRPISLVLIILTVLSLMVPLMSYIKKRKAMKAAISSGN